MLPLHHPYLVAVRGVEPRIVLDMNQDPDRQDTAQFEIKDWSPGGESNPR
ncbi:hypothetical protein [Leptolyngbya sp. NIES-2104]|nr:hypothetical protein [Leptolyngbya sp. NIES-2104]